MSILSTGSTITGGSSRDYILSFLDGPDTQIVGGGNNDIILGDMPFFFADNTANYSLAGAVNRDMAAAWSTAAIDIIGDAETIPHATLYIYGDGAQEFFTVTVGAGETLSADVDFASFDSVLIFWDAGGNQLAQNNDGGTFDAGSQFSAGDSFLSYINSSAGAQVITVGLSAYDPDAPAIRTSIDDGAQALLHLSISGHDAAGEMAQGNDAIDGGDADDLIYGMGGDDTIYGGFGADVIVGGAGNDVLLGFDGPLSDLGGLGSGQIIRTGEVLNDSFATAISVDGYYSTAFDADIIESATQPHVSIIGTGDNSVHYYEFTVSEANTVGTFDVDYGHNFGGNFDPWLNLYNAAGTRIAFDDDSGTSQGEGGSFGTYDSYLVYNFTVPGTYFIAVGRYSGGGSIPTGGTYELQISLDQLADTSADQLYGGAGDDYLYGGFGADIMDGGSGDDVFIVDNIDDVLVEAADGGQDTVYVTSRIYAVAENVENIVSLVQGASVFISGNAQDNVMSISSLAFGSVVDAGAGNDVIYANNNLTVIGNLGDDIMYLQGSRNVGEGGIGEDTYIVFDATTTVTELSGEGTDTVYSYVNNMTLADNVENLILLGVDVNGSGNDGANTLIGTAGNNSLYGGAGADFILGGAGDDIISGGEGLDTLHGNAGADAFVYNSVTEAGDIIQDWVSADDGFAFASGAFGTGAGFSLTEGVNFISGDAPAAASAIATFLWDSANTALYFDIDGDGERAAILIADLQDFTTVTVEDIAFF